MPVKIFFFLTSPKREGINQNIGVVARVEINLAADGGHADAVAVATDAGNHAGNEITRAWMVDGAEAQGIERGDRTRAHGEDIAQDAADAGGRALIGLDKRRMIVAFHLERHSQAIADIDNSGVLSRALQHVRSVSGQEF